MLHLTWMGTILEWGAMAYRLEGRTLNRENPVSNPTAGRFEPLASLITPRCHSSLFILGVFLMLYSYTSERYYIRKVFLMASDALDVRNVYLMKETYQPWVRAILFYEAADSPR